MAWKHGPRSGLRVAFIGREPASKRPSGFIAPIKGPSAGETPTNAAYARPSLALGGDRLPFFSYKEHHELRRFPRHVLELMCHTNR